MPNALHAFAMALEYACGWYVPEGTFSGFFFFRCSCEGVTFDCRAARHRLNRSTRSRVGLNTGAVGSTTHPARNTTGRVRSRSNSAS
jgi:hypothetical protein